MSDERRIKRFSGPEGAVTDIEISKDYENAERFERIRVGEKGVFFPHELRTKFIPYDYADRVFLRINEVNGKLCCGNATFYYYRLVFVHNGKEFIDTISENEQMMRAALAAIEKKAPQVRIGYEAPQAES